MEILDNLELPANAGRGGAKGSKFMTDATMLLLAQLAVGQAFIIPFMNLGDVKDPAKRQRYATDYRVKEWAKGTGKTFKVVILDGKGIAVKLIGFKAPDVVPVIAPEVPAEQAAE